MTATTTPEQALALYDEGIPNEIDDPGLRRSLNHHRWGNHGPLSTGQKARSNCPACKREAVEEKARRDSEERVAAALGEQA
jgi:hypothetical protein